MSTMSTESKQLEKMIGKEAKAEEKNLNHLIKDLAHADKATAKAAKAVDKALHHVDKAVSKEHKTANEMVKADHKHKDALSAIATAEKEVAERKRQAEQLAAELEKKKALVDNFAKTKSVHDSDREHKLADIHTMAANNATAAAGITHTNSPVPMSATSGMGPSAARGGPDSTTTATGPSAAHGGPTATSGHVGI